MTAQTYGPGRYHWALNSEYLSGIPGGAQVSGHGFIDLTEPESALSVCSRLVRELGGPELASQDSTTAFTIRPVSAPQRPAQPGGAR
ncbi:hypothetical protein [Streptomyces sp. NRRL F-2747]|uniref:hypothetical protein n=1 Tax=Streptomyces sp. NRRL F-2747 TaxID=1463843 RepID=UPI0004C6F0FA|nr:hypothetical protein [Streptomyces sp. NRRL F-2747]